MKKFIMGAAFIGLFAVVETSFAYKSKKKTQSSSEMSSEESGEKKITVKSESGCFECTQCIKPCSPCAEKRGRLFNCHGRCE